MSGVHDMGGVAGFGPINPDPNEPLFHTDWERQVLAVTLAIGARGLWSIDESRASREAIPPDDYLSIGYYRIWLRALEALLAKHRVCTTQELQTFMETGDVSDSSVAFPKPVLTGHRVNAVLTAGGPVNREPSQAAAFQVGQSVCAKPPEHSGHTRLPGYVQGHCGEIFAVHGCHVFADSQAAGAGEQPQWLYNVRFKASELWGTGQSSARWVHVDCWEPYLESLTESAL